MSTHHSLQLPIIPFEETDDTFSSFTPLGPDVDVLLVWPKFPRSFYGMEGSMCLVREKAHMEPLALITIAALLPKGWRVWLIDRAFQILTDEDILNADLVMLSAMHAQRSDAAEVLSRCRQLGRRTLIGGPWANIQPEVLLKLADHVVVGEADEGLAGIAADFEAGCARRLYRIAERPDVTRTPVPRFDLLDLNKYLSISIQFSRGCPFQCEFCDIPPMYGRKPRTKRPSQVLAELDALYDLGWRGWVSIADDNFIGNHHAALELTRELARWQKSKNYPFSFSTEASVDLAERRELMDSMAEANFLTVFLGIESPSLTALQETKKFQNLRHDILEQVRTIQSKGVWVTAGFIVGFDSDDASTFDRQQEFIRQAAIPLAILNLLQAIPTTPLHKRLQDEGRLVDNDITLLVGTARPNFRTVMPLDTLLGGASQILCNLYEPDQFFERAYSSLEQWKPIPSQRMPRLSLFYAIQWIMRSIWIQGVRSNYRAAYWKYVGRIFNRWGRDRERLGLGCTMLTWAHHLFDFTRRSLRSFEEERQHLGALPKADYSKAAVAAGAHR
jgi:radical SAM superfamily enzyme YgiQ (UPF0313 family)